MNIVKTQEVDTDYDVSKNIYLYNMIKTIVVKDELAVNEMIKVFQTKYNFKKYIEVINLEENDDFKKFLNVMVFNYSKYTLPNLNVKSKKFKKINQLEIDAVDKAYTYSLSNYTVVNYIFYTLYIMSKNLDGGFDSIDKLYKKKLKGNELDSALFFNKTDKYNALSNYAHILLYMVFYNTSFMPIDLQKYFKDLFNISNKGDKLIKECNNVLISSKDTKLFVCNYPDTQLNIASSRGINKLFQIISDNMLLSESLELTKTFLKS